MISKEHQKLREEYSQIRRHRGETLAEFTKNYDETVYFPAKKELQNNCKKIGHIPQKSWIADGKGGCFKKCEICDSICEIIKQ